MKMMMTVIIFMFCIGSKTGYGKRKQVKEFIQYDVGYVVTFI